MALVSSLAASHDTWHDWVPQLSGLRTSSCKAVSRDRLCIVMVQLEWVAESSDDRVILKLPSNVRCRDTRRAAATVTDCTDLSIERTSGGHAVVGGDSCTLVTHGVFVAGRTYSADAQIAFEMLV